MQTKARRLRLYLSSLSLTAVLGIALFASPAALAADALYVSLGSNKTTTSGTWDLGYPLAERPDIESTDPVIGWMDAPTLGASGFSWGMRFVLSAGIEDSIDDNGYFDIDDVAGRTDDDLQLDVEYTYEETARLAYSGVGYYSFAGRFHPYFEAGAYYAVGSDASMKGRYSGICAGTLDRTETGTTFGLQYGAGMLVSLTQKLALLASYNIYDNVDFEFEATCAGVTYPLASLDSEVEAYGLSLLYEF